jgi:hypothetical protein
VLKPLKTTEQLDYFLSLTENQFVMATLSILDFEGELPLSQGKVTGKVTKIVISYVKEKMFDIQTFV